jgi:hypothetical protein
MMLAFGTVVQADIDVPTLPPTEQVQEASTEDVAGAAIPVDMVVQIPESVPPEAAVDMAAVKERVKAILEDILKDKSAVVLVSEAPPEITEIPDGYAKNLATDLISADKKVEAVITNPAKGLLGKDYIPVKVVVKDSEDKVLGKKDLKYRKVEEAVLTKDLTVFLGQYIRLTEVPAPVVVEGEKVKSPVLKSWIESSDGADIRVGGKIAIYYTADTSGYVSVYHFGSSGSVQRIYPNPRDRFNFIEAGKVYRFPASGWLSMSGDPGKETVKLVLTTIPSNTPRVQEGGIKFKMKPLHVIPTHFPVLFTDGDMMRFFALPPHLYTEIHIKYQLQAAKSAN